MGDVIWSCPDCEADLDDDWWCEGCGLLWLNLPTDDPPEYDPEIDDE